MSAEDRRRRCDELLTSIRSAIHRGDLWNAHQMTSDLRGLLVSMHALGDDEAPHPQETPL